jgi:hypothetical protein
MKKQLIIMAALALCTTAFAGDKKGDRGDRNDTPAACDVCTKGVIVKGPQIQITAMQGSASVADANSGSHANNNMSSNTNGVLLNARSTQLTALSHTGVLAKAANGSYAQNNLASNIGNVGIGDEQLQVVATRGSFMGAMANNGSRAVQNFSTNNACVDCN